MHIAARNTNASTFAPTPVPNTWIDRHSEPPLAHEQAALTALRAETIRVAAVTVAATSIAVHLTRAGATAAAQFSTDLMRPAFSSTAATHVDALTDVEGRAELAQAWKLLNVDLANANRLSALARNGEASISEVRTVWQRSCRTLLEWFALLQPLMLERGAVPDAAHDAPTIAMLRRAKAGETPVLDPHGPFAAPSGNERRREFRHDLSIPVTIAVTNRPFAAVLGNLSSQGALVNADRQVPTGNRVAIVFADGRELHGKVCWSNVRQMGVMFDESLACDDALWTFIKT